LHSAFVQAVSGKEHDTEDKSWPSSLFTVASDIQVVGPTGFPKPSLLVSKDAVVAVEPAFGKHRPNEDAVFAYAEGQCVFHSTLDKLFK
jgi:hypothetical protein